MTPAEARAHLAARYGDAATTRITEFLAMVIAENERQNLISPATVDAIWTRHALDSAQLVDFAKPGLWIDVGTGGGFPGIVVALLRSDPVVLVEPRSRRATFLREAADRLGLDHVAVAASKIEKVDRCAAVISARAVAAVEKLLQIGMHCATSETRWLLPRGRLDDDEVVRLRSTWHGMFHVEHSITDPASAILVIDGARPR